MCDKCIAWKDKTKKETARTGPDSPRAFLSTPTTTTTTKTHDHALIPPGEKNVDHDYIFSVAAPVPQHGQFKVENQSSILPVQPRASMWQRLKWAFILSVGCKNSLSRLSSAELKLAIGSALEATLMGSALVLTVSLQIQEVVGGRGGLKPDGGHYVARYTFVIASALSFALCFYAIMSSFVLLLELSPCPPRYVSRDENANRSASFLVQKCSRERNP